MPLVRDNRDLRVDFFRGLALWWIFTDHIPGDVLGDFSLRNFALCDATEVFVLLAGYAAGLSYGRSQARHGWLFAAADVVRRAWTLYVAHIFLFVVFTAQVAYSAAALDRADFLDEVHLDVLGDAPYQALLHALLLHFQPAYLNILPMYVVVLLLFALWLPLLRRPYLLGLAAFVLYAAARLFGLDLPSWTGGGWFFNPLTWQLLFMIGAILSTTAPHPPGHDGQLPHRLFDALATLVLATGLLTITVVWQQPAFAEWLPPRLSGVLLSIDKEGLHPFRLASILALAWLVVRLVPPHARWLKSHWAVPFLLAGQHSLPVFCCGIFLAFLGRLAMEQDDGAGMQVLVNVLGAAALVAIAALAAWYREKGRNSPARGLPAVSRPDTA